MDLRQSLAGSFAARYPLEAAAALETRPTEEIARVLRELPPSTSAAVLRRMSPGIAARSVERLDRDTTVGILTELKTEDTLSLLRRVSPDVRDEIIKAMPAEDADALNTVIRSPAGTAGALMDPRVVALPMDIKVEEALKAVRHEAEHAHDNLYVVDRERRLAGVISLQELLLARPKDRLEAIMQEVLHRLLPSANRHAIARNPGWRDAYSLPVVDRNGRLLGAIHYRVLKTFEEEFQEAETGSGETAARALGDLFWTGIGGVMDALAAAVAPPQHRPVPRSAAPPTGESQSNEANEGQQRRSNGEE